MKRILPVALVALLLAIGPARAAYPEAELALKRGLYAVANSEALKASKAGDIRADWLLGYMALEDLQPNVGLASGIAHLTKAAQKGDGESQLLLGWAYSTGTGVKTDDAAAVSWYHRAAKNGQFSAMLNLANRYFKGRGVPQDFAESIKWALKTVQTQRDAAGAYLLLGKMYEGGLGVKQDLVLARTMYMAGYNFSASTSDIYKDSESHYKTVSGQLDQDGISESIRLWRVVDKRGVMAAIDDRRNLVERERPPVSALPAGTAGTRSSASTRDAEAAEASRRDVPSRPPICMPGTDPAVQCAGPGTR